MPEWIICIAIGIAISLIAFNAYQTAKAVADMRQLVSSKFEADDLYITRNRPIKCIGVNFSHKEVILGSGSVANVYDFTQITAVEVIENGLTVTHNDRGSQALRIAMGSAVLGPLGAVVGGLGGTTYSHSRTRELSLRIAIDSRDNPVWLICFFSDTTKEGSARDSNQVTLARSKLERMHAHLRNAMKQSQV